MTPEEFVDNPPRDGEDFTVHVGSRPAPSEGCATPPPPPKGRDAAVEGVHHPKHYGGADDPFETIKVLRAWMSPDEFRGFLSGNVIKYLSRLGKKGPRSQDAAKAALYAKALADFEGEMDRPDRRVAP